MSVQDIYTFENKTNVFMPFNRENRTLTGCEFYHFDYCREKK